jgi:hypothetical protein
MYAMSEVLKFQMPGHLGILSSVWWYLIFLGSSVQNIASCHPSGT